MKRMRSTKIPLKYFNEGRIACLFYGLIIVFVVVYLINIDYHLIAISNVNYATLLGSMLLGFFSIYWGSFVWLAVLKNLGAQNLNTRVLVFVYAKSWLGRYIPGTAPWILGKIGFASKQGVDRRKLAVSSVLEAVFQVIATVLLSLLLIMASGKAITLPPFSWIILTFGIIASGLIIQPKIFSFIINKLLRLLRKQPLGSAQITSNSLNLKGVALYSLSALSSGLAMSLLVVSLIPLSSFSEFLYITGVSNLAAVIGMMAIFVPSGLGVREVTFIALLNVVLPLEQAVLVSIVSRLWSVAIDLLFYLISYLFRPRLSQTPRT